MNGTHARITASALSAHLQRHYGIDGDIQPIPRGRAANFLVSGDGQRWLLKVFQPDYALAKIEQAADFVTFVSRAGYPTREFVRAVDGQSALMLGDRVAVLIPWIDGLPPEPNQLSSPGALSEIGALCGRLHRVAAAYPRGRRLAYAGSTRTIAERAAALVRVAEQCHSEQIADEVNSRLAILARLGGALERSQRDARRGIIHGDFSGAHVVFDRSRAVGVIDVMGELYFPGWELMRAFFQSVPFDPQAQDALVERWRVYLDGYAGECAVRRQEVALAYDVYLLQLASSTYGLRLPLDDGLRAFGRWRTHLAQYLADQRAELPALMGTTATGPIAGSTVRVPRG